MSPPDLLQAYRNLPDINDADADLISDCGVPVRKRVKRIEPIRTTGRDILPTSTLLELLDLRVRPGLTDDEFGRLFVRCGCGLILTHQAFHQHSCSKEVIDLTSEGTDSTGDE